MSSVFLVVVLVALVAWLVGPSARRRSPGEIEPVDEDELSAAEREVRDLGVHQRPEDGFEGDDWGPGTGARK